MATYTRTYTASLCSRTYNGTANRYQGEAATHGYYGSNGNWVGMVLVPVYLSGYRISAINMTLTGNAAGTTASKTVYIYTSNYQTFDAKGKGSIYPSMQIGSISGRFRNNTVTVSLTGSLLSGVADYLASGNQMLILYDPTESSANYCRFTSISLEITYSDPISFVWTDNNVYVSQNGTRVNVSWNPPQASGGSGGITYYLYANTDSNLVYSGAGTSCTIKPPAYNAQTAYYVFATYSGIGLWSKTAYHTALGVTLTAPVIQSLNYTAGVFAITWGKAVGKNGDPGDTVTYTVFYGDAQQGFEKYSKSAGTALTTSVAKWIEGVECRFFVRAYYNSARADSGYASYTIPAQRTVMYCQDGKTYIECIVYYCPDGNAYVECIPHYCTDGQTFTECSH